jgi:hypothetical protein
MTEPFKVLVLILYFLANLVIFPSLLLSASLSLIACKSLAKVTTSLTLSEQFKLRA